MLDNAANAAPFGDDCIYVSAGRQGVYAAIECVAIYQAAFIIPNRAFY